MKLYVVRHGQSVNNLEQKFTGWTDAPLTEKGIRDAEGIRDFLSRVPFDKVWTSDLQRAKKTAETALPGCSYETTELIREICIGKAENQPIEQCCEIFGPEFEECRQTQNYVPVGGENRAMLTARVQKFLDLAAESGYERAAVFAHGGVLKTMVRIVLGEACKTGSLRGPNCSILILDYDGKKWRVDSWLSPDTVF